ncbi:outer membrane protein assembly factor [Acinetobacter soli]|uniref:autotransporter assembly complex protein TamA n=1 Tax=Acinetobacter soli TaxID=487316 RepID=UPI000F675A24|nr:autotransporter assembly complex family protein [Acinetobacter soli]RSB58032.1 outer membrane protein assembly factor [Acinetobacter soli]
MLATKKFKQSALAQSVRFILNVHDLNKLIYTSMLLGLTVSTSYAQEINPSVAASSSSQTQPTIDSNDLNNNVATSVSTTAPNQQDSLAILQQQAQSSKTIAEFKPIEFEDLENLPSTAVDSAMANEIYRVAEQAKAEAQATASRASTTATSATTNPSQDLAQINQAPVNVDNLMQQIRSDSQINVQANTTGQTLERTSLQQASQPEEKKGFFKRIIDKIKPKRDLGGQSIPRITAEVKGAPTELAANIKAKLSSYSQEAFQDFNSSLPQLRNLSNQAAQAVGYYNAEFKFEKLSDSKVRVNVIPHEPVKIEEQNIDFTGSGASLPQFQVIRLVPEQDVGDILNHGKYEETKSRIATVASDNGFFDSYWRLHDVRVNQPQNTADINLKYETGERYQLGNVEFRMSDPSKKIPLDMDVLLSMTPWKEGDDYTFWRVNALANNLTNSRYFNYTLVDTIKPDPIQKPLELPPDLQALVDQDNQSQTLQQSPQQGKKVVSANEVTQNVVDEAEFAGTQASDNQDRALRLQRSEQKEQESERNQLENKAREEKKIPVIVTLNADRLNSIETGFGYGTDTGFRVRGQYRRAIVNSRGHSFDANMEVSQIRQAVDVRYNIPYKHPLNDYISIVGGFERELDNDIGPNVTLETQTAVIGAERIIKNPLGGWQQTYGVRYRVDSLNQRGTVDESSLPDAFKVPGSDPNQQALLFGYSVSKTSSNNNINPTKGFKQTYKLQVASDALISDANIIMPAAAWRAIYSVGENDDHQFVGRADLGYIFTNDFEKVPYNLRYFAGGDESIRGFDYKSLAPLEFGYKVGGQALAVGSLEYNYQFKEGWRAAVFSDFGNAYDKDFNTPTEYGVGVGIRWKSPVGPIRIDVASGISDPNHPIRLHFFIGPQL